MPGLNRELVQFLTFIFLQIIKYMHTKVLLVDDDDDDQVMFLDALGEISNDVECITMNNGVEAIKSLKILRPLPSIIFLDLNMPLMNGFECLKHLKKDEQYKKIPVVIFTTSNSPEDQIQA